LGAEDDAGSDGAVSSGSLRREPKGRSSGLVRGEMVETCARVRFRDSAQS
jgi:hypothetical protein